MDKKYNYSAIFWVLIFVLALSLRYWYSSTELCFYTDQSRDAIVVKQIIQGEWKLFGPVVNGRGAVFHGVLYYYLIAPLYALGGGNPLFVSIALSLISTIALIPTYFLAKEILKSKTLAFIVIALISVSFTSIETSASFWNLQLSIIFLPIYCLFLLKMYKEMNVKHSLLAGLMLGLLIQSGFSNIQWLLPYAVVIVLLFFKQKAKGKYIKNLLISLLGLGITTSSMILVEILAWKRGLFALEDSLHWLTGAGFSLQNLQATLIWCFNSINNFLIPQFPFITLAIILIAILVIFLSRKDRSWLWLGLLLLTPIAGQLASNGAASYILTGYESIFYIFIVLIFAKVIKFLEKNTSFKNQTVLLCLIFTIFMISNIAMLQKDKISNNTLTCMLESTSLEELQAIDYTYQQANGEAFSIDVVAEPYGINTKYGYLYSWYGKNKYGYTPMFSGGSQDGYIGEGLLEEVDRHSQIHFIIYEPGTYNYWFRIRTADEPATRESLELFYYRQPPIEYLQENKEFGDLIKVDYYLLPKDAD